MHTYRTDMFALMRNLSAYPNKPKMVKLNKINVWDAMSINIEDYQRNFVLDAKGAMSWSGVDPIKHTYVLQDSGITIGMVNLSIDNRKSEYAIDIAIIDKAY